MIPSLQVILPCYNPNNHWQHELLSFHAFISPFYRVSYIIVNDGSVLGNILDQISFLQSNGIQLDYISYEKNRGKGFALRKGMASSQANYIIYTDIDFPFENQSVKAVADKLVNTDLDVVAGFRDKTYYLKKMSAFRRLLSRSFRFFMQNILRMPLSDTQCGLKGVNKNGKNMFLSTTINRYLFDFEFIFHVCKTSDLKIGTVPVELKSNVSFSKMKVRILFQEFFNLLSILVFSRR